MNNLLKRTLAGLVFLVVMVFGTIWNRTLFGALFLIILYTALREFYTMTLGQRYSIQQKIGLLTAITAFLLIAASQFFGWEARLILLALFPLLLIPVSCIFFPEREGYSDVALIYAGLGYIALPICLSPLLVMDGPVFDGWKLLPLFIIIWVSDVGAYCVGSILGQKAGARKLAPEISPNKSWWGFWGGLVFSVVVALVMWRLGWLPYSWIHSVMLGIVICLGGVCGDLFESEWKRCCRVKDSGNSIPGHGGMLDRFDSSLIGIPLGVIYLLAFGLI